MDQTTPSSLVINTLLHNGGSVLKTIGFYVKGNDSEMEDIKGIDSRATGWWTKPLPQSRVVVISILLHKGGSEGAGEQKIVNGHVFLFRLPRKKFQAIYLHVRYATPHLKMSVGESLQRHEQAA